MKPSVTVIIPTRGKAPFVRQCLKSLFASFDAGTMDVESVVIEQGGEESKEIVEQAYAGSPVRWMKGEEEWGFSALNNAAAATSGSEYLLLLNNDTICRPGFLDEMLSAMEAHPDVGIVGAKLLFLDGAIQHVGVAFRSDGIPYHVGHRRIDDGTFGPANRSDYFDAVTFACVLIRRSLWTALGGLCDDYHFNYEDVDFCLRAREKGVRCWMQHTAIVHHLENQSCDLRKDPKKDLWENLKILRDKWITTGKVEEMCSIKFNRIAGTLRDDRLNIGFIPSSKGAGVPWWRMELPARKIAKLGLANVQMFYGDTTEAKLLEAVANADLLVVQGFWSEWAHGLAAMRDHRPFGMAYDYDDHPLHISPFAQAYRTFGTREIELQNRETGKKFWLWRDGEHGFDVVRNVDARARQLEIFHMVDLVTTSTEPLARYFKTLNPSVAVLPNCIDFDVFRHPFTLWERTPGPVRIGWHGGDNHFHDIEEVGPEIVEFVNANDVKLVLFGAFYRGALLGIDESKVEEQEWVHVEAFPHKLASLGIDVGLVPLADEAKPMMAFNGFKSAIKFYEYAALRVPCVIQSGRRAYPDDECIDGVNCLRFASGEEMKEQLGRIVADAALRHRLGTAALEWVHEYRDLEKEAPRWLTAYQRVARHEPLVPMEVPDEDLREPGSSAVPEGSVAMAREATA